MADLRVLDDTGAVSVRISRIGFVPFTGEVLLPVDGGALVFVLAPLALEPVRVAERVMATSRLRDVDGRIARRVPNGAVLRDEIDARNPVVLSQLLRRTPGLRVADSSGVTVVLSSRGEKLENMRMVACRMRISLDGVLLPVSFDLDQVPPSSVHAIEIYTGVARVPPELAGIRRDAVCGLIAIWTRSG